ncbi:MAG: tyrosine-type recombinase/integrase [Halorhodospira sp.]
MATCRLTQKAVDQAAPGADKRKVDLFDTVMPGLLLKVLPSGQRRYYTRHKGRNGKTVERKLADARVVSLREARELARQRLAPSTSGAQEEESPTLEAFVETQYRPFARSYKRSYGTDEILLRRHLLPRFSEQRMDQVGRYDIQRFLQERLEIYRPSTVNRLLILLRYLYNLALRWEVPGVTANPTHGIDQLKENNKRERYLTADELQRLLQALESPYNPYLRSIVTMMALTGARRGEVLRARWDDVDLERAVWRIPQPKATERRHVPLSEPIIELLQGLETWEHSEWLFPNPRTGEPFGSIYSGWNRARKDAGLPELRLHDLRHSFASLLVNSGHSLYEVQRLLGHTQIATTQRYAHLSQERLLAASNDVARVLEPVTAGYANEEERS